LWLVFAVAPKHLTRRRGMSEFDRSLRKQIRGSESFRICIHLVNMGREKQFSREEVL
jgi:hypothetical protein